MHRWGISTPEVKTPQLDLRMQSALRYTTFCSRPSHRLSFSLRPKPVRSRLQTIFYLRPTNYSFPSACLSVDMPGLISPAQDFPPSSKANLTFSRSNISLSNPPTSYALFIVLPTTIYTMRYSTHFLQQYIPHRDVLPKKISFLVTSVFTIRTVCDPQILSISAKQPNQFPSPNNWLQTRLLMSQLTIPPLL